MSALIWDYKVENDDDSADDIDDDDSSEGTNEDKNDSDEESKSNIKDEDDACSPTTKKREYSPARHWSAQQQRTSLMATTSKSVCISYIQICRVHLEEIMGLI